MTTNTASTVTLLGSYGNDYTIIDAARTSTGKAGVRKGEDDRKLLAYLYKNGHLSPLEQVSFQFHVHTPIFIARQMMRHRTGKWNEASARYKQMPTEFFFPAIWREQNKEGNKQGSSGALTNGDKATLLANRVYHLAEAVYLELLEMGVAKEQARIVLPVGLYTELVVTFDLRNLLHFLELRLDSHAQPEIQTVARQMLEHIRPIVPWTVEIFMEDKGYD